MIEETRNEFGVQEDVLLDEVEQQELERAELLAKKYEEKYKHSVSRKGDVKAKKRKAVHLDDDDLEVYRDNPDKYYNKKGKKTLKIRQNKKHLANKKERAKAKEIARHIKNGNI